MKDGVQYKMGKKKDRDAMKGKCETCGTTVNKILSADDKKKAGQAAGATGWTLPQLLGLCAGTLRSYMIDHDELPDTPLVAACPVSVRTDDDNVNVGRDLVSE